MTAAPAVTPAYLKEPQAAVHLNVSLSHFQDHIRPHIPRRDFSQPGAKRPMWRYAVTDLEAYAEGRRLKRPGERSATDEADSE